MVNQSDTLSFGQRWFDGEHYIELQKSAIEDRMACFDGRLYMEIWWKFLYDAHASRVLPWFFPDTKKRIFSDLLQDSTILFCINSLDVIANRQLSNEDIDYQDYVIAMLIDIKKLLWVKAKVVVNRIQKQQW